MGISHRSGLYLDEHKSRFRVEIRSKACSSSRHAPDRRREYATVGLRVQRRPKQTALECLWRIRDSHPGSERMINVQRIYVQPSASEEWLPMMLGTASIVSHILPFQAPIASVLLAWFVCREPQSVAAGGSSGTSERATAGRLAAPAKAKRALLGVSRGLSIDNVAQAVQALFSDGRGLQGSATPLALVASRDCRW